MAFALLSLEVMPGSTKDSQVREREDDVDAPLVDELEIDERMPARFDDETEDGYLEDSFVEDIDLDDLSAMEGPDI